MRKKLFFLLFYCLPLLLCAIGHEEIVSYATRELPLYGTLEQDEAGFVYIDVDNRYIYKLIEFIQDEGFKIPPYFEIPNAHGAHISVIYSHEAEEYSIPLLEEAGSTVAFQIKECQTVNPPRPDIQACFLLTVACPACDALRQKYSLPSPKYDYHITVGIK